MRIATRMESYDGKAVITMHAQYGCRRRASAMTSPAAVLISPDELAALEDTLDLLSDPQAMAELAESRGAYRSGDYLSGEDLRSRYLRK